MVLFTLETQLFLIISASRQGERKGNLGKARMKFVVSIPLVEKRVYTLNSVHTARNIIHFTLIVHLLSALIKVFTNKIQHVTFLQTLQQLLRKHIASIYY